MIALPSRSVRGAPAAYWLLPLAVVLLRAVPFLATRLASPPPGAVFPPLGYNPIDGFAYVGFIRQAAATGDWLLFNPHTLLPQDGRYFLPVFSALGWVCRWTGLDPFLALELARVPLIFAFFAVFWRFAGDFLPEPRVRIIAAALAAFAGGVEFLAHGALAWLPSGWHRALFEAISDDHGWSAFAAFNNPLWVGGLTLALAALRPLLTPAGTASWRAAMACLAWAFAAFLVHPYSGLGILAVGAALLGMRWLQGERRAVLCLAAGLAVATAGIAALSAWQNRDPVFHATARGFFGGRFVAPLWYPLTLGALGGLAVVGARGQWLVQPARTRLLLAWLGMAALLHSSPWTNGYHFIYLLPIPLCLLAAPALDRLLRTLADGSLPASRQLAGAVVLALLFQSALAVTWRTTRQALAYAIPVPVMQAIDALGREPAAGIYTSPHLGTILPACTDHRVALGHWFLTPDHTARQRRYGELMAGRVEAGAFLTELRADGVRFVLLPPGAPRPVADALAAASGRVEVFGNYGLFHLR